MDEPVIDSGLLEILRCPVSGLPLSVEGDMLVSAGGSQRYPVVQGIPCLLSDSTIPTHEGYKGVLAENRDMLYAMTEEGVANFVQANLVGTCGNLFRGTRLNGAYPIPDFPRAFGEGKVLDIGCSWGRWTMAGALAGYPMIGMDIHWKALLCARWLAKRIVPDNMPLFVLADARHLPFGPESLNGVFSYSCIQHFSKANAERVASEIGRVLKTRSKSLVQMANRGGIRSTLVLARRGFSEGSEFDVRYYSIPELTRLMEAKIGRTTWFVDCFLGLNVHRRDQRFVTRSKRWIITLAEMLRQVSDDFPALRRHSDSVFVSSTKN